ncbi:MAG: DUF4340 domain-containing protein [Bacteroidota bacterium]
MNKNRVYVIVFLLLAITAGVLVFTNRKSTIKDELKDFAVKDTAAITKIFMADKLPTQVTLTKEGPGMWTVNGKYAVRKDEMDNLLETIHNVDVRTPVSKAGYNNVIKALAVASTKVEIYVKDQLIKTYYVGGSTADNMGTFMMIENSSTPFVTYIPGFNGYLTTRYFTNEMAWRDRTIFNYNQEEIASIKVEYPVVDKKHSFEVIPKTFTVSQVGEAPITDTAKVGRYVGLFKHVNFEGFADGVTKETRDSVLKTKPLSVITITDTKGNKDEIRAYLKMVNKKDSLMEDEYGKHIIYDVDRMFALINNGKDFVVIQHFIFDPIMVSYDYFKKSSVKKPKT